MISKKSILILVSITTALFLSASATETVCNSPQNLTAPWIIPGDFKAVRGCLINGTTPSARAGANALYFTIPTVEASGESERLISIANTNLTNTQIIINCTMTSIADVTWPVLNFELIMSNVKITSQRPGWQYFIIVSGLELPERSSIVISGCTFDLYSKHPNDAEDRFSIFLLQVNAVYAAHVSVQASAVSIQQSVITSRQNFNIVSFALNSQTGATDDNYIIFVSQKAFFELSDLNITAKVLYEVGLSRGIVVPFSGYANTVFNGTVIVTRIDLTFYEPRPKVEGTTSLISFRKNLTLGNFGSITTTDCRITSMNASFVNAIRLANVSTLGGTIAVNAVHISSSYNGPSPAECGYSLLAVDLCSEAKFGPETSITLTDSSVIVSFASTIADQNQKMVGMISISQVDTIWWRGAEVYLEGNLAEVTGMAGAAAISLTTMLVYLSQLVLKDSNYSVSNCQLRMANVQVGGFAIASLFFINKKAGLSVEAGSVIQMNANIVSVAASGSFSTVYGLGLSEPSVMLVSGVGTIIDVSFNKYHLVAKTFLPYVRSCSAVMVGIGANSTSVFIADGARLNYEGNLNNVSSECGTVSAFAVSFQYGQKVLISASTLSVRRNTMLLLTPGGAQSTFLLQNILLITIELQSHIEIANNVIDSQRFGGPGPLPATIALFAISVDQLPVSSYLLEAYNKSRVEIHHNIVLSSTIVAAVGLFTILFSSGVRLAVDQSTSAFAARSDSATPLMVVKDNAFYMTPQQATSAPFYLFYGASISPADARVIVLCNNSQGDGTLLTTVDPSVAANVAVNGYCSTMSGSPSTSPTLSLPQARTPSPIVSNSATSSLSSSATISPTQSTTMSVNATVTSTTTASNSPQHSVTHLMSSSRTVTPLSGCPTHCANVTALPRKEAMCGVVDAIAEEGQQPHELMPVGEFAHEVSLLEHDSSVGVPVVIWKDDRNATGDTLTVRGLLRVSWAPAAMGVIDVQSAAGGGASNASVAIVGFVNVQGGGAELYFTIQYASAEAVFDPVPFSALLIFGCITDPFIVRAALLPPAPPAPILPAALSSAAAMASVVSGIVGGGSTPDLQTTALLGLSACAKGTAKSSKNGLSLRSVAPLAIEDSCKGAVIGNFILVGAALAIHIIVIAVVWVRRGRGSTISFWQSILDRCRFPSLTLSVMLFSQNGFFLCGLELARGVEESLIDQVTGIESTQTSAPDKGLGIVAAVWTVVPIIMFLVIAFRLSSRAYYPLYYRGLPAGRCASTFFYAILPSGQLDKTIPGSEMFATVVGRLRWPHGHWVMCSFFAFIAAAPISIGEGSNCTTLYGLSVVLHFIFAVIIAVARPFRIPLSNALTVVGLVLNGTVVLLYTFLLNDPFGVTNGVSIDALSSSLQAFVALQTANTVIRSSHSLFLMISARLVKLIPSLKPFLLSCDWEVCQWPYPPMSRGVSRFAMNSADSNEAADAELRVVLMAEGKARKARTSNTTTPASTFMDDSPVSIARLSSYHLDSPALVMKELELEREDSVGLEPKERVEASMQAPRVVLDTHIEQLILEDDGLAKSSSDAGGKSPLALPSPTVRPKPSPHVSSFRRI